MTYSYLQIQVIQYMRRLLFLLLVVVSSSVFQSDAQNFQGTSAQKIIAGSEFVRIDERSGNVEYVRFHEKGRFPMSKFPTWAKKALLLDGLELREEKSETDKLGVQHIRYQVLKNGIPVLVHSFMLMARMT